MKRFISIIAVMLVIACLVSSVIACTDKEETEQDQTPTAESLKAKYEEKGYTVAVIEGEQLEEMGVPEEYGELEYYIAAYNESQGQTVNIACFVNSDGAKKAYDDAREFLDANQNVDMAEMDVKMKGRAVAQGTKAAVAIFSGDEEEIETPVIDKEDDETLTFESLKKKYQDKGYTITTVSESDLDIDKEVEYVFAAANMNVTDNDVETVIIICFVNSDDAQEYYNETVKMLEEETDSEQIMLIKKKGNAVAHGTKDAVAIF